MAEQPDIHSMDIRPHYIQSDEIIHDIGDLHLRAHRHTARFFLGIGIVAGLIVGIGIVYGLITKPTVEAPAPVEHVELASTILPTTEPTPIAIRGVTVRVVDNTIVTTKDGKETVVAQDGQYTEPILSPDARKVAYLSTDKQSSNVWIVNVDGTRPLQLTKSAPSVMRSALHWLDNNRLVFIDGEDAARIYTVSSGTSRVLFGSNQPKPCSKDCTSVARYSPDSTYLVLVEHSTERIRHLNLKTLKATDIRNPYASCVKPDSVRITNTTLSFSSSTDSGCKTRIEVNVELSSRFMVVHQNSYEPN